MAVLPEDGDALPRSEPSRPDDVLDVAAQPACPECGTTLRDAPDGYACASCGFTETTDAEPMAIADTEGPAIHFG